jgi:hypothetical protein
VTLPPRGRPPDRLLPTARRRGSPGLRRPVSSNWTPGVSRVTGPSSSAVPQSTTPLVPLRLAISASRGAAFRVDKLLGIQNPLISGLHSCGPPARLTTLQPPPHGDGCKSGYQPAGYALTGWGSHPQDDSSRFRSYILDLLPDRHCPVASIHLTGGVPGWLKWSRCQPTRSSGEVPARSVRKKVDLVFLHRPSACLPPLLHPTCQRMDNPRRVARKPVRQDQQARMRTA